jgi:hypothetical protein
MLQTAILFILQIISIYITIKNFENMGGCLPSINSILTLSWVAIIQQPLLEESLFRGVLKHYIMDVSYGNYLSSILFGLFHVQNYLIHGNVNIILFQICATTYLGYYLYQFDSFLYGYLVHMYYNAFIMCCTYSYIYWKNSQKNDDNDNTKIQGLFNVPISLSLSSRFVERPKFSSDDSIKCDKYTYTNKNKLKFKKFKNIDANKMFDDIWESNKKLQEVIRAKSREALKKSMEIIQCL